MIRDYEHAIQVQRRRRESGKKGRSKAVRRWFKRTYGRAPEAHGRIEVTEVIRGTRPRAQLALADLRYLLNADFTGCRSYDEVHR